MVASAGRGFCIKRMVKHTAFGFTRDKKNIKCRCTLIPSGVRMSAMGRNRTEAQRNLYDKLRVLEGNVYVPPVEGENPLTIELYAFALWVRKKKKLKANSVLDKNSLIKTCIEPYEIGKIKPSELKRRDIKDWLMELEEDGKGQDRIKKAYNVISGYYSSYYCQYVDEEFLSPARDFKFDQTNKFNMACLLSDKEYDQFISTCIDECVGTKTGANKYLILICILYQCLRVGEACTLQWSDIDVENMEMKIRRSWTKDENGKYIIDDTKTYSSERTIAINTAFLPYLEWESAPASARTKWVFPSLTNPQEPLSISTVQNLKNEILDKMGIDREERPIRVHDLRHNGASYYLRHSDNTDQAILTLQKLLGHKDKTTTERIYLHMADPTVIKNQRQMMEDSRANKEEMKRYAQSIMEEYKRNNQETA